MSRLIAVLILVLACAAVAACGGDSGGTTGTPSIMASVTPTSKATPAGSRTATPVHSPTARPTPSPSAPAFGTVRGVISAPIIATTLPDCQKPSDFAITVSGTVADHTMTLVIKGAPGTYDLAHQYQTKPTIDLTIDGISPGTWHATTGGGGSGKLTIQEEGRGSIDVTLSGPTGASAEGETVSANWQCS